MKPEAILIFYLTVSPILAIVYITIVVIIFRYMNPEKNPSLMPERIKTGVQALLYLVSLLTFFGVRLALVILDQSVETYFAIMLIQASILVTDISPMAWVIRCHINSFKASRLYSERDRYMLL